MPAESAPARRYRFGPRSDRRTLAGVRVEQVALIALAALIAVLIVRAGAGVLHLAAAFALVAVTLTVALWPLDGRTAQQWAPVAAAFSGRMLSSVRIRSHDIVPPRANSASAVFHSLRIRSIDAPAGEIGATSDLAARTLSGVIRLHGEPMLLLDKAGRQRITDSWSTTLGALAQQPGLLHRLSWIERTVPDHAMRIGAHAVAMFEGSAPTAARSSYLALLEQEAPGVLRHECFLVVTVRALGRAMHEAESSLVRTLSEISGRCAEAGIESDGVLSPSGLRSVIEREFAPGALITGAEEAMPSAVKEEWGALLTGGTWRATYWVAEWPRVDVTNDFLMPYLLEAGLRRSSVVVMEPRSGMQAVRQAERARTEKAADLELRRSHGFAQTARSMREQEAIVRRESELSLGHGAFRFSGYVSVVSVDRDALEKECARLEQAGARAHLVLRRLYGAQARAATFVLPVGRGR